MERRSLENIFDAFEALGISKEDGAKLCDILLSIHVDENAEKELEDLYDDPFAFEGGGPSTRELLLMLAKDIQG